ncbi:hypothetical protein EOL70_04790 [Leucothrix sargassi]|nr:hypothetical protein EOL70_04790 [Leucothrix sargassi]
MADDYTAKMFEASAKHKKRLEDGEALLKSKRQEIGVFKYYDLAILRSPENRPPAKEAFLKYVDHLIVEKNFYTEFHRSLVEETVEISSLLLDAHERERLLTRSMVGLKDNNRTRTRINEIKLINAHHMLKILEIYDRNEVENDSEDGVIRLYYDKDIHDYNQIMTEMDALDEEAFALVDRQEEKQSQSKKLFGKLFQLFSP